MSLGGAQHTIWRSRFCTLTGWMLVVSGSAAIASWLLAVPLWQRVSASFAPTIGTGISLALIGAGLLAWLRGTSAGIRLGRALELIATLLATAFLIEHLIGISLPIDLPSLHSRVPDPNPFPGRTSPNMAIAILLSSLALCLGRDYIAGRLRRTLAAALLAKVAVSMLAPFGRPDVSDVYSFTIPIQFGDSIWYRLPIMHPLMTALFGLTAISLFWIDTFAQSMQRPEEAPISFRRSDFFFGVALMLLLTVAMGSYGSIKDLQTQLASADEDYQLRATLDELIIDYHATRSAWAENLARPDPTPLNIKKFETAAAQAEEQIQRLLTSLPRESEYGRMIDASGRLLHDDLELMRLSLQHKFDGKAGDHASIVAAFRAPQLHSEQVLGQITAMRDMAGAALEQRRKGSFSSMRAAGNVLYLGSIAGFAVLCIAFAILLKAQKQRAVLDRNLREANEALETRVAERTQAVLTANRQLEAVNATLEQRVTERTTALAERTADLEDFSYSVSHDLRAPLRAIDGYAHILEEDHAKQLDEGGHALLHKMRGQVKRMGELVDNLLRLSRFGRQALVQTRIDMTLAVREIWQEILHDMRGQGVQREPELRLQPLPAAHGDPDLLRQVWMNIIENAVKFSSRVEQPVVIVEAIQSDQEVVYAVRDNGAGFDMRYADKLFGVFQRLHDQSTFSGTGVGLAIASKIIRRHGGRIWAESAPGSGAIFYFSIPREPKNTQIAKTAELEEWSG